MITIRTAILSITLFLGLSGEAMARGWSREWDFIGVAEDRTEVLVQRQSVRELPPSPERRFAVRQVMVALDTGDSEGIAPSRRVVLFRYDCTGRRMLIAAATDYAADGSVLARNSVAGDWADGYEPVEPDTLGATIMAQTCGV